MAGCETKDDEVIVKMQKKVFRGSGRVEHEPRRVDTVHKRP